MKKLLKLLKLNESTISMLLGGLVVIVVAVLVVNYFRNVRQPAPVEEEPEISATQPIEEIKLENLPTVYSVKEGDSLWKIAESVYGSGYNWVDLAKENKLNNPNRLLVGQELKLPKAEVRQPIAQAETKSPITENTYKVVKGDSLWLIAVRAYGDGFQWVKIARENNLVNPNLIHPGNVLTLPR